MPSRFASAVLPLRGLREINYMKLEKIEIKNYRSLFHDYEGRASFTLDLGTGMNAITGPNNVGKSNVFRALALALDPDFQFNRMTDMPSATTWSKPVVTLTFRVPTKRMESRERTLLKHLEAYERAVMPKIKKTFASQGIVKLRVTIDGTAESQGTRHEVFVANGGGARKLATDDPISIKALSQFHKCFHFVMISSGQSLESLMEGNFRDILHNVLRENLKEAYTGAEESRTQYLEELQEGLLQPLAGRIGDELRDLFPEIASVDLLPNVLSLEETLAKMQVRVSDNAITDLGEKGTGVRGGLIISILRHFAEVGKRSMLFAVEEPESFLHPAAQEHLRVDLEALAVRDDISLLVSTHSPYIVSRDPQAKVFALAKLPNGGTALNDQARGDEPHAQVLGGLFRDRLFVEWLDRSAAAASEDTKLTVVVEGGTDQVYAEIALQAAGRTDLLEGLAFLEGGAGSPDGSGGASMAVMQALLARSVSATPVAALFDNDEPGQEAMAMLRKIRSKTGDWGENKRLFNYQRVFEGGHRTFPYEAEDLWPDHLYETFFAENPDMDYLKGKVKRPRPDTGWHYDLTMLAKSVFVGFLRERVTAEDTARWVQLYEAIWAGALGDQPVRSS
ncbi:AAA domain/AAA ATPase domain [Actinobacteria bacterium IMCC26207]|nr:AAA domain/AAA ATPase domain [Actinobacteria bacterium IMCC26207]